ncbi:hypothetical protein LJB63_22520, partial [[Eubacterium] rectale]|nr:hypothetical protein [Agathobacter rectalis]
TAVLDGVALVLDFGSLGKQALAAFSAAVNPAARIRLTPPWNFFSRADPREMRLTRQQSMTRAFQFARVRNEGPSVAGRLIVLSATPLEHPEEPSKFGIICT